MNFPSSIVFSTICFLVIVYFYLGFIVLCKCRQEKCKNKKKIYRKTKQQQENIFYKARRQMAFRFSQFGNERESFFLSYILFYSVKETRVTTNKKKEKHKPHFHFNLMKVK